MKKALKIARFEFVEKARTKTFLIFVVLFPIIMGAVSIIPALLVDGNKNKPSIIGVLDNTDFYTTEFIKRLDEYKLHNGGKKYVVLDLYRPEESLNSLISEADKKVTSGFIAGYLLLYYSEGKFKASFRQFNILNSNEVYLFEKVINQIFVQQKLKELGYHSGAVGGATQDIKIAGVQVGKYQDIKKYELQNVLFPAIISLLLLFMLILFSGGELIRSVMEEKSNRIMEILLSSCSSKELLTGKVLGLAMLGLFQILIWGLIAFLLAAFKIIPVEIFSNIGIVSVYFVLGYLLYTSIFVGAGSIVSTEQEAQHFTSYISLFMMLPLVISFKVIENPNLLFVKILSYLPLTSPPVMLLRLKISTPPLWEIILTISILIISVYITIFISAKIFRIGILSYGKHPSMKELYSWLKQK